MIDIFVISEARFYGEGLARVLPQMTAVRVSGAASSLEDALPRLTECEPDVVLLDTALANARVAVGRIAETAPDVKVVALAIQGGVSEILDWAETGIAGYTSCDDSLDQLVSVVESAVRDELNCSPTVAAGMLRRLAALSRAADADGGRAGSNPLTAREMQVLTLIETGLSNKGISRRLDIGLATTKSHVHNILNKLNVERRTQAAAWFRRHEAIGQA